MVALNIVLVKHVITVPAVMVDVVVVYVVLLLESDSELRIMLTKLLRPNVLDSAFGSSGW